MNQDLYIHGLSKTFSQITALHETNLVVRRGKFTTLLGPSGCGKTTLLRLIAGLEIPDTGTIMMGEEILFRQNAKGYSRPSPPLWHGLSGFRVVAAYDGV